MLLRVLGWGYVVGLHLLLAVVAWKTDAVEAVQRRFDIWTPAEMSRDWQRTLAYHGQYDVQLPPGTVLFIGDSLIERLNVARFGRPGTNYGIGGDTSAGVLTRLDNYRSLGIADRVVLLIGINDLIWRYRTPEELERNLAQIVARVSGLVPLVAVGLLPVDEAQLTTTRNAVLKRVNADLARACAASRRCRYVDAWPLLAPDGGLAPQFHIGDGLHLSRAGYDRLAAAIAPALSP